MPHTSSDSGVKLTCLIGHPGRRIDRWAQTFYRKLLAVSAHAQWKCASVLPNIIMVPYLHNVLSFIVGYITSLNRPTLVKAGIQLMMINAFLTDKALKNPQKRIRVMELWSLTNFDFRCISSQHAYSGCRGLANSQSSSFEPLWPFWVRHCILIRGVSPFSGPCPCGLVLE